VFIRTQLYVYTVMPWCTSNWLSCFKHLPGIVWWQHQEYRSCKADWNANRPGKEMALVFDVRNLCR
jgi:hypothetical protein